MKYLKILLILLTVALLFTACEKDEITGQTERRQIVLLTDYSAGSDVLISIIGNIKNRYPSTEVNYIEASPFNIMEASYQLKVAAESYPAGTCFLALVEPGTNSQRMVFKTEKNQLFVIPNNSLATRLFHAQETPDCYQIENPLMVNGLNPTNLNFLEVYTSALFDLIDGREPTDFGTKITHPEVFEVQDAKFENGMLYGQIIFTDNFGNCVTNISGDMLSPFTEGDLLQLNYGGKSFFASLGKDYSSVPIQQNVIFLNGLKKLELAVNYGNLADRYTIGAGTTIQISQRSVKIGMLHFSSLSEPLAELVKSSISDSGIQAVYLNKNANGHFNNLQKLINELIDEGADIIVPFSTPAAQAAVLYTPEKIPLVYTVVTDPESSGILDRRKNITGLSDAPDFNQFFQFVKQILPGLTKCGSIYNSLESNSLFSQKILKQYASLYQADYVSSAATTEQGITEAFTEIRNSGIQALLISGDNLMANNCSLLAQLGIEKSIPVFGTDVKNTSDGALASLSIDYNKLCRTTGDVVVSVIRGQQPDNLPVIYFDTNIVSVNKTSAGQLGIILPDEILKKANYIYE